MIFTAALFLTAMATATPCGNLKSLSLPDTTITMAELVAAGPFQPPAPPQGPPPAANQPAPVPPPQAQQPAPPIMLPAHCRVAAVLKPSSDSHIEIEVWLPAENWNGKFQAVGNGGWAGTISYAAMGAALREGYATASTDTGHKGGNALFAINHPEKLVDFAYRAVHEMAVKSKALITAFYDRAPRLSYWNGCSTGGRQGLMSAQRYPEDFDAILAGAPANYQTHLHAGDLAVSVPTLKDLANFVPADKAALLNKAVIDACDAGDGVTDGLLNDPRTCRFDASSLLCREGETGSCLTAAQIESVKRVYAPTTTTAGTLIFPGKAFGSETGWGAISGSTPAPVAVALGSFQVAYNDANWDWRTFNLERDTKLVDEKLGFVNAIDPNLQAFKARGGKLLLYHGWNDTAIAPGNTITYYESVLKTMGPKQDEWIRLFMAPGMQHCGNGPGPNQINFVGALERWREAGEAPAHLLGAHVTNNRVDMTRPLCPYPQVAHYSGTGSTNDAANFVCKAP